MQSGFGVADNSMQQPSHGGHQPQQGGQPSFGGVGSGFGGNAAQNMLLDIGKQNLEQYIKVGEKSFLTNYLPFVRDLRQYFRVDHQYVRRKTTLLFAPYLQKRLARGSALSDHAFIGGSNSGGGVSNSSSAKPSAIRGGSAVVGGVNTQYNFGDDGGYNTVPIGSPSGQVLQSPVSVSPAASINGVSQVMSSSTNNNLGGGSTFKMPIPTDDVLAPDLYIPSMALLTYVALCGFIRGMTDNSLQPEFLAAMLWSLILWELFEVACVMVASYAFMTPMVTLDALSLSGYKHVGVCVLLLVRELFGLQDSYIYLVPVLYVAACSVLFAYNTIKMFIARRGDGTVHVRSMPLLYGWSAVQALFVFWFAMKPF